MNQTYPMVAKTFQGLEDVLADELRGLGALNVEPGLRMVSFEGDLATMYRANVCCRTALRILKPIVKFEAADTDELYDMVRDIDWEQYLQPDGTFSIDSTVNSTEFTHSKFVTYRVKDGIADHFSDKYGHRPSIRLAGADMQLNVHIADRRVTISLDSSGEPLSRRGYRTEANDAPLNEVMAAGIILKTGWHGECDFADPMCGSGTFLIEAALIAANIWPGVYRRSFAFERWPDFDEALLDSIVSDTSAERPFTHRIYGGDIDPETVSVARRNIRRASVEEYIDLTCRNFEEWDCNGTPGTLVTNPPYGERLRPDDIAAMYRTLGSTLKNHFQGWHAWILGYRDEHFDEIGLRPSVRFPLLNGALECSLREYVLFAGRYDEFKTAGGSVHNDTFVRQPSRPRQADSREWNRDRKRLDRDRDKESRDRSRDKERRGRDRDTRGKAPARDRRPAQGARPERPARPARDSRPPRGREERHSRDERRTERREGPRSFIRQGDEARLGKAPSIPADKATVFSAIPVRSRRVWRRPDTAADTPADNTGSGEE